MISISAKRQPSKSTGIPSGSFRSDYAQFYDLFYSKKDYDSESDFIVRILHKFGRCPWHRILDISSGTGGHALALARRGFQVQGLDRSAAMIQRARGKATGLGLDLSFRVADMRSLNVRGRFDACITMFDSVNYLGSLEELGLVLAQVHDRLRPGGILILQAWNGGAALRAGLRKRSRRYSDAEARVIRVAEPTLDAVNQSCQVKYTTRISRNGRTIRGFTEVHRLTIFTLMEIKHLLRDAGLSFLGGFPPYRLDRKLSPSDWSMVVVARR
jgi:2-polyprenyl-3-methyl-5-hydroxy-6-metoxy-1,4-benzoquinol methylase